jgi:hypothetical protein
MSEEGIIPGNTIRSIAEALHTGIAKPPQGLEVPREAILAPIDRPTHDRTFSDRERAKPETAVEAQPRAASAAEAVAAERLEQRIVLGAEMEALAVAEIVWGIVAFRHRTLVDRERLEAPVVA